MRQLSRQSGEVERADQPGRDAGRRRQRAVGLDRAERRGQVEASDRPGVNGLGQVPRPGNPVEPKVVAGQARPGRVEAVEPSQAREAPPARSTPEGEDAVERAAGRPSRTFERPGPAPPCQLDRQVGRGPHLPLLPAVVPALDLHRDRIRHRRALAHPEPPSDRSGAAWMSSVRSACSAVTGSGSPALRNRSRPPSNTIFSAVLGSSFRTGLIVSYRSTEPSGSRSMSRSAPSSTSIP